MIWHNTSHYIASNDVTITGPDPATDIKTSKHFTSKHKTSAPWNGRRLVHSKDMIWASRWSVALRAFYRQILSVIYSSFPFGNFRPRLVRALLVAIAKSTILVGTISNGRLWFTWTFYWFTILTLRYVLPLIIMWISEKMRGVPPIVVTFPTTAIILAGSKNWDSKYVGVSLNGGTPKTPQNDHF